MLFTFVIFIFEFNFNNIHVWNAFLHVLKMFFFVSEYSYFIILHDSYMQAVGTWEMQIVSRKNVINLRRVRII